MVVLKAGNDFAAYQVMGTTSASSWTTEDFPKGRGYLGLSHFSVYISELFRRPQDPTTPSPGTGIPSDGIGNPPGTAVPEPLTLLA